jgi:hypothetical protein
MVDAVRLPDTRGAPPFPGFNMSAACIEIKDVPAQKLHNPRRLLHAYALHAIQKVTQ